MRCLAFAVAVTTSVVLAACATTPRVSSESLAKADSLSVVLQCDSLPGNPGFTKPLQLRRSNGMLSLVTGSPGKGDFERWDVVVSLDGAVTITGEYIQSTPEIKKVQMTGTINDTALIASGTRGPRKCLVKSV